MITAHGGFGRGRGDEGGATDFVSKPWSNERLLATVRTAAACGGAGSTRAPSAAARRSWPPAAETPLLGNSPAMARVASLIERAAPTDANVLILGENGTGKELVAREIHRRSRRADEPMVSVDLGAAAETLFESELFGHVKGAFTDAARRPHRPAPGGGRRHVVPRRDRQPAAPPAAQTADRARAARGRAGRRQQAGADRRPRDRGDQLSPDQLADEKRFRQDLLFRLNTVEIDLPPLRERREDIPLLLDHYLRLYARKYDKPAARASAGRARRADAP